MLRRTFLLAIPLHFYAKLGLTQSTTEWQIDIDDSPDFARDVNEALRGARLPAYAVSSSIDIKRTSSTVLNPAQKKDLIDNWQRRIARFFLDENFRIITSEELEDKGGVSFDQIRREAIRIQPFGHRGMVETSAGRQIFLLMNERPAACRDRGIIMITVFAFYPRDGVQSDYGNITTLMIGIGGCGRETSRAGRELRELRQDLRGAYQRIVERA
ncbi:hypothetical protein [Falsiroseomonas sp. E2-1-a20]|uniref:hypothetical protein n=1 Tax=Falsiroseomonas sp. E2-1-a20 TaxID=3239300 RepID=UPI003F35EB28